MSEDATPEPPVPPTCCAAWLRTPSREPGACTHLARWVITGRNVDGEPLLVKYACADGHHQAQCSEQCWWADRVVVVEKRVYRGAAA